MKKKITKGIDFQFLFESAPGLYLVLLPDLKIVSATDAYLKATLTNRDEIIGQDLFDVFPDNPDDLKTKAVDTMRASVNRVLKNKTTDAFAIQRHDVRQPKAQGGGFVEKYWRPVNTPIFDDKGEIKYILHSVEDVTEYLELKKLGEAELERHARHLELVNEKLKYSYQLLESESKALLKSQEKVTLLNKKLEKRMYFLTESMPLMVWTTDAKGNADYFNNKFLEFSGKKSDELQELGWRKIICPDDLDKTMQAWESANKNLNYYSIEHRLKRHDGVYIYHLSYANPMLDENKNVILWLWATVNIHDRKLSEQYLINSHEELKKLNAELDNFVYSISHEFRAPLTNIMGMTQVGKSTEDVLFKNKIFIKIQNSAKKLDGYIMNTLDYSRNSRLTVEKKQIDFIELINQSWENYKYLNETKHVELKIETMPEVSFISDKQRLQSIFNNLISNAIKYADPIKTEPCVNVSIEINSEEATIVIEDNGVGIEQEQLNKVFEIFYRASEFSQGSGLGLFIVKELVAKLKGNIKAISRPGVGTSFVIKIPNG